MEKLVKVRAGLMVGFSHSKYHTVGHASGKTFPARRSYADLGEDQARYSINYRSIAVVWV